MRSVINKKNIATDNFRIWKVFIPVDKVDVLRENPSELKDVKLLKDEQNITSIRKVLNHHIQVFIGHPDSMIVDMRSMINIIQELVEQNQDLIKHISMYDKKDE